MTIQRTPRSVPTSVLALATSCCAWGCSLAERVDGPADPVARPASTSVLVGRSREPLEIHQQIAVPDSSVEDWVTYGDMVVTVTVESETELEADQRTQERGKGYVGRQITVNIDNVLWKSKRGVGQLREGSKLEMLAWGWIYDNGELLPVRGEGSVRMDVGSAYLMPLAKFARAGWSALSTRAVLPLDAQGEILEEASSLPVHTLLAEISEAEIRQLFEDAKPDARTEAHANLPPIARWHAVAPDKI